MEGMASCGATMRIGTYGPIFVAVCGSFNAGWAQVAQHHHELHQDHYKRWQRPDVGGSCCNARFTGEGEEPGDCEPTTAILRGGQWFAWLRDQSRWVEVPDGVILREMNPTPESAHICFAYDRVLCFVPPLTGS